MKQILLCITMLLSLSVFSQYENQSTGFKKNKGQILDQKGKLNGAVKHLLTSNGLNVQLRKNGFSYDVYEVKNSTDLICVEPEKFSDPFQKENNFIKQESATKYKIHRIDINFINSNADVQLIAHQKSTDYVNYYNLPHNSEGITKIHMYR